MDAQLKSMGWFLLDNGLKQCIELCSVKNPAVNHIIKEALSIDLRNIGCPKLPENINSGQIEELEGPVVLQIQKVRNVTAPMINQESQGAPRMLRLQVTDGVTSCVAIELSKVSCLNVNIIPGTKICLMGKIKLLKGVLLLEDYNVKNLGGEVEKLKSKWEANKTVDIDKRNGQNIFEGPPLFKDFDACKKSQEKKSKLKSVEADAQDINPKKESRSATYSKNEKSHMATRVCKEHKNLKDETTANSGKFQKTGKSERYIKDGDKLHVRDSNQSKLHDFPDLRSGLKTGDMSKKSEDQIDTLTSSRLRNEGKANSVPSSEQPYRNGEKHDKSGTGNRQDGKGKRNDNNRIIDEKKYDIIYKQNNNAGITLIQDSGYVSRAEDNKNDKSYEEQATGRSYRYNDRSGKSEDSRNYVKNKGMQKTDRSSQENYRLSKSKSSDQNESYHKKQEFNRSFKDDDKNSAKVGHRQEPQKKEHFDRRDDSSDMSSVSNRKNAFRGNKMTGSGKSPSKGEENKNTDRYSRGNDKKSCEQPNGYEHRSSKTHESSYQPQNDRTRSTDRQNHKDYLSQEIKKTERPATRYDKSRTGSGQEHNRRNADRQLDDKGKPNSRINNPTDRYSADQYTERYQASRKESKPNEDKSKRGQTYERDEQTAGQPSQIKIQQGVQHKQSDDSPIDQTEKRTKIPMDVLFGNQLNLTNPVREGSLTHHDVYSQQLLKVTNRQQAPMAHQDMQYMQSNFHQQNFPLMSSYQQPVYSPYANPLQQNYYTTSNGNFHAGYPQDNECNFDMAMQYGHGNVRQQYH